ncbi:oxidoreductase CipA-like, putative [Metarhizium acridum CQMa 102]|uniref:Oxidoreductase CipA-like, putative n=1 Tax=Metarhizium acridum (strain CQMa 102) TaxID=655827 RepID=E9EGM5_METAQ|nr:oxidoreductase CipA-like, putative [Metarhizium acridum CQMa 102]EFY84948.1 oxidoreductase CipA-like, putative [Metarhizium acridum CQMa 102]
MSETIKAVGIVGAVDNMGSAIFKKLTAADQFKVRVLGRNGSTSKFADQVDVVNVDFDSVDWLTAALAGQDAVIAVLGFHAQPKQENIVDAAIAAGVKRFLPSELGSNSNKPNIRKLRHFAEEASIFDGGNVLFSTTAVNTMTDAIVAILSQPDAASNCVVYVQDVKLKQNKLLKLTRQADGDRPWTVESVSLDTLTCKSDEPVAKGLLEEETFAPYAWRTTSFWGFWGFRA